MHQPTSTERITEQFRHAADDASQMTQSRRIATEDTRGHPAEGLPLPTADMTLDDLRRELGERWDVAKITAGYKATTREPGGTPIPRYGRTPAELAESIRHVEHRP